MIAFLAFSLASVMKPWPAFFMITSSAFGIREANILEFSDGIDVPFESLIGGHGSLDVDLAVSRVDHLVARDNGL